MIALIIGISLGFLVILTIKVLKQLDERTMYGLILSIIGALYVGFTWMDTGTAAICIVQSLLFIFIAYCGLKRNILWLVGGYFLHGVWDILFHLIPFSDSIPPHYDIFCLSIDFTIGAYLIVLYYQAEMKYFVQD